MIRGACTSGCDSSFDPEVSCQKSAEDMLVWIMCSYSSNSCNVSAYSAVMLCLLTFGALHVVTLHL